MTTFSAATPCRHDANLAHRLGTVVLAGALFAGVVACGSDDDAGPVTTASAPPTTAAPDTTPAPDTTSPSSSAPATTGGGTESTCVTDVEHVVASAAAEPSLEPLPAELVATLDAAAQASFQQAAAPGAIVGVQTPEGTWTAAYGLADPEAGTPMEVEMYTRIGSVTKTFTGTVIMQLEEQGLLSLDDAIDQYVDDIPNGDRITLRMLADMTSGLASYTRSTAFTDVLFSAPETVWTPEEVLEIGLDESPIFEPGAEFDYSNTNTILLGMVIEEVTGEPVEDVFQELIFDPLGLDDTSWPARIDGHPRTVPAGLHAAGRRRHAGQPEQRHALGPLLVVDGRRADLDDGRPTRVRPSHRQRSRSARRGGPDSAADVVPRRGGLRDRDGLRERVGRPRRRAPRLQHERLLRHDHGHDGHRPGQQRHRLGWTARTPRHSSTTPGTRSARPRPPACSSLSPMPSDTPSRRRSGDGKASS